MTEKQVQHRVLQNWTVLCQTFVIRQQLHCQQLKDAGFQCPHTDYGITCIGWKNKTSRYLHNNFVTKFTTSVQKLYFLLFTVSNLMIQKVTDKYSTVIWTL
jgi:hypothetical protein